ncbi:Clathrin-binding domain of Huntingtin-interacting protein 1 [Natronincola peptidivorans]|uniref:Clathrin-binding domain of Huntingtin-interacting protein 1 n=1 Tax=Natronincola peptidivorans TaxID=426128 RepID=A0A1H9ZTY4_9FIRM|nr:hypothetical protein [Natronincola peptidivorans]SES85211.1 Clathrin-binding domain of Huntingtin-interacting protein 1 [Natronincola peptidivorans]
MSNHSIDIEKNQEVRLAAKKKKARRKKIFINILLFILSVGFWGAAVYYGYTYAKDYIDTSIHNVQQENAVSLHQLTEQIQQLNQEIAILRQSIEATDSTLSSSTSVQERIDSRLEELDHQLGVLERSLQILKEAPNVQN